MTLLLLLFTEGLLAEDITRQGSVDRIILILGDSLSSGFGLEGEPSWVDLLDHKLTYLSGLGTELGTFSGARVVNASIAGETSAQSVRKIDRIIDQYHPVWVFLELGANDALRGTALSITKKNLNKIITTVHASGAQLLLFGIRMPPNYGPIYNQQLDQLYLALKHEHALPFIPFFLAPIAEDLSYFQEDQLHPNALAQPMIFEHVWGVMKDLINNTSDQAK